ncbi:MAG: glutamyl-tRNA reductase [Planctomycetaceae bacterium]|nr:glutamyl-tRNA reductase [Planctomycetaceae bacterium]
MKLQLVGCSHHTTPIEVREQLAFSPDQIPVALSKLRSSFPNTEAVLLSTCNRVELYTAAEDGATAPRDDQIIEFLAGFHGLKANQIAKELFLRERDEAVRHLFRVAASLDSMVMGEAQILSQVKEAYRVANDGDYTGPMTHSAFQGAMRVASRVATETAIHQRRVSIPSVAVADFASQIFERFDDKQVLVIGAGEMGRETLNYLIDAGVQHVTIINRNQKRAEELAQEFNGQTAAWNDLPTLLSQADLVISTTGASEPIFTLEDYRRIETDRYQRTLFILDLAVPRDFDAAIGDCLGVYLYSVDDLQKTCETNRKKREKEWPKAQRIIDVETDRFLAKWNHRITGPTIRQLQESTDRLKKTEIQRLMNKLGDVDDATEKEIQMSFDRLVKKLLHPPLESLRDEAEKGTPHGLLDALKRLFQLRD